MNNKTENEKLEWAERKTKEWMYHLQCNCLGVDHIIRASTWGNHPNSEILLELIHSPKSLWERLKLCFKVLFKKEEYIYADYVIRQNDIKDFILFLENSMEIEK